MRVLRDWHGIQGLLGLWGDKEDRRMETSKEGDDKDDWASDWGVRMDVRGCHGGFWLIGCLLGRLKLEEGLRG